MLLLITAMAVNGCSREYTQTSFNRIENGMTYDQVVAVLGEPTESKSMGIGSLSGTSARWEDAKAVITITFVNQKVKTKRFRSKSDE